MFVRGIFDDRDLLKGVDTSGRKAGEIAAKGFSDRMKAGILGLTAGAGVLFAAATKGALEMEGAASRFRAETGATRAEAEAAAASMNALAGANLQTFDEVSRTLIAVTKNLGLTGAEAERTTDRFLKFATATGQDAAEAVVVFDDLIDRFGLDAAEVGDVMDRLIVSTQTYGGTVKDNQATLAALAPTLQAMNLGYEDGIELLGFFNAAGVDAGAAISGLGRSIKSMPPGTTFDDIVKHIAGIEDPAERAREAVRIFGRSAGPQLANALKPGMTSLDDFGATAEDAAGATEEAAAAIADTIPAKIQQGINAALSIVRGFGGELGPVLTAGAAAANLAPMGATIVGKMGLGAAFSEAAAGGIAGMRGVFLADRTLDAAGDTVGKRVGGVFGRALAFGAVGGVALAGTLIWEELTKQARRAIGSPFLTDVAAQIEAEAEKISAQTGISMEELFAKLAVQLKASGGNLRIAWAAVMVDLGVTAEAEGAKAGAAGAAGVVTGWSTGTDGIGDIVPQSLRRGYPAIVEAGTGSIDMLLGSIRRGYPALAETGREAGTTTGTAVVTGAAAKLTPTWLGNLFDRSRPHAKAIALAGGAATTQAWADGILSRQRAPQSAWDLLVDMMKNTLSPAKEIAQLEGRLSGERFGRAIGDQRPWVRAQAQSIALAGIERLATLKPGSEEIGRTAMTLLRNASEREKPAILAALRRINAAAGGVLDDLPGVAAAEGAKVPGALAGGIDANAFHVQQAVNRLADILPRGVRLESPAKEGPWSKAGGPLAWAEKAGKGTALSLAGGLLSGIPSVRTALHSLTGGLNVGMPLFAGLTATAMPALGPLAVDVGTGTVRHDHSGNVRHTIHLSGETIASMRAAGASWTDIGDFAARAERDWRVRWKPG